MLVIVFEQTVPCRDQTEWLHSWKCNVTQYSVGAHCLYSSWYLNNNANSSDGSWCNENYWTKPFLVFLHSFRVRCHSIFIVGRSPFAANAITPVLVMLCFIWLLCCRHSANVFPRISFIEMVSGSRSLVFAFAWNVDCLAVRCDLVSMWIHECIILIGRRQWKILICFNQLLVLCIDWPRTIRKSFSS